jgi:hypothetical protein
MSGLLERLILRAAGKLPLVERRPRSRYEAMADEPEIGGIEEVLASPAEHARTPAASPDPIATARGAVDSGDPGARIESVAREIRVEPERTRAPGPFPGDAEPGDASAGRQKVTLTFDAVSRESSPVDAVIAAERSGVAAGIRDAPRSTVSPAALQAREPTLHGADEPPIRETKDRRIEREHTRTGTERATTLAPVSSPVPPARAARDGARTTATVRAASKARARAIEPERAERERRAATPAQEASPQSPTIRIAIGTVEIRAAPSRTTPDGSSRPLAPRASPMGLDEYLRRKGGG